jgi:hypothetical protein
MLPISPKEIWMLYPGGQLEIGPRQRDTALFAVSSVNGHLNLWCAAGQYAPRISEGITSLTFPEGEERAHGVIWLPGRTEKTVLRVEKVAGSEIAISVAGKTFSIAAADSPHLIDLGFLAQSAPRAGESLAKP